MRKLMVILLVSVLAASGWRQMVHAAPVLPSSDWYAVAWVESTNMLHWINADGEQASMVRPTLPGEAPLPFVQRVAMSPDGRYMVVIASLTNNNIGIGFYDLMNEQFVQTHEAQPGEVLPTASDIAFSFNGSQVALTLRGINTGEWRVIVFETATGNALDQLTRTSPVLHETFITDPTWWPVVADFNVDEGIGQAYVMLQVVTDTTGQATFPSFRWYPNPVPALAGASVVPAAMPFSPFAGHDVLRTTKAVAFTGFDDPQTVPPSNAIGNFIGTHASADQLPVPVVQGAGFSVSNPVWLKDGAWIGYRVQNAVQQPHIAVTEATADTSVPLGPNIRAVHSTPDGFVAVDTNSWQLYHATTLDMDAFAPTFGNTVFASGGLPFTVVYTTPVGAVFALDGLPPVQPGLDVAAGDATPTEPTETPVIIVDAPVLPTATQEPIIVAPPVLPTATQEPIIVAPPVLPTATQQTFNVAPPSVDPTDEGVIVQPAFCQNAPPAQISVGMQVVTLNLGGTLAMRTNLSDPYPSNQIPAGQTMSVLAGPQCRDGLRMWQVSTNLNGQSVTGWVADGAGSSHYLAPQ